MQKNQIIPFCFDTNEVRTMLIDDQPWFVAVDICQALAIRNNRDAIARLDDDERGVATTDTPSGQQDMGIINESGLYSLVLTSRKTEAKRFKKWITAEVLPAIRKTGTYSAASQEHVAPSLSDRRWLIYFDHNGKECVTPVPNDAIVMTHREMLRQITAPNGLMISTEEMFEFVEAATANLKRRSAYQAQRLQQISL